MSLTEQQVFTDIARMKGWLENRETKYTTSYNRYQNNGNRAEDIWELYGRPVSYRYTSDDTGIVPILNVIKSVVDTHISKLSQTKTRPFFNPIQGTYKTRKVCRNAQVFFDEYFEKEGIYKKSIEAARDAEIFEYGCLWVDDEDKTVYKLNPWEFFYDPAEANYGKMSRCYIKRKNYPLNALPSRFKKSSTVKGLLEADPFGKGEYVIYFDLENKEKHIIIAGRYITKEKISYSHSPVVQIWYTPPIKGGKSTSIVDNLYTIQEQIDELAQKIKQAAALTPANTIFVPKGSGVKPSMISNEIGMVMEYQPVPGINSPIEVSTPRFIDSSYIQLLEFYEQRAYNMEGVSMLSAQSKKPSGLNSGVALQTLEDVESERHNLILQNYIKFLMDLAKTIIEVFPENDEVLPKSFTRASTKWKDIKKARDTYTIQFSAASSLSKDPKTKMEQIEKLLSMQLINPNIAAQLLEFPDLEDAYSIMTASYDSCQKIIDRAVETGEYDFYEVVNIEQLMTETINTILRLDANDEDPEVIERLVGLLNTVKAKQDELNAMMAPPPPPPPAPGAPVPGAPVAPEMMPPQ